jgi:hypothetical protein
VNDHELWHRAEKNDVHKVVLDHVRRMEEEQADVFDRFLKLETLYDPNGPDAGDAGEQLSHVQENVIASTVDTVTAIVSTSDVRARFLTDGADWATQRRCRHLEWYAEELVKLIRLLPRCRDAFREAAKKGNGLVKVHAPLGRLCAEHVLVENIVVDGNECRDGRTPRQLHQWIYEDLESAIARFPRFKEELERARTNRTHARRTRKFMQIDTDVEMLESWRLPTGMKGDPGYRAGRHTIVVDGATILDEKWEREGFPFAMQTWSKRIHSWYGISGSERIAGIQRALNRRNWQIERQLDQAAVPTTYLRPVDAGLAQKKSRVNGHQIVKGDWPVTVAPTAVSGETYQSRLDLRESAHEEFGVSRMAAHAAKPAGIDSGIAMREFHDQTTQRFAPQERQFEQLVLDAIELAIETCKELGDKAPTVQRKSRFGKKKIPWTKVHMPDVRVQIAPASNLGRTPAGRAQLVLELAQAGIINTETTRRLIKHPDLERELSLYTAALESVEHCLDEIADGATIMPEPFMNLEMIEWRGQAEYLIWQMDGAPEARLESLRSFVVNASNMADEAANANMPAAPGMVGDPGAMPALPGGPPPAAAPAAALSAQAMDLRAG